VTEIHPETPAALAPLPPKWTGKYRKKPVVIQAVRWTPADLVHAGEMIGWLLGNGAQFHHPSGTGDSTTLAIQTLEGEMTAQSGDWIIRGVKGEFYPCKPDIFEATYDPASPPPAPEAVEVPPDGAIIARAGCDGGVLILALGPDADLDRATDTAHKLHEASGLKVIAVADVAAVRVWHPHDAPAELAALRELIDAGQPALASQVLALREQLAIAAGALRDIKDVYPPGHHGHDIAHTALDEIGGVKPSPPGEADQLREQLGGIRDRLDNLARGLDLSASGTSPSKKSEIEHGCAEAVRQVAESITWPAGADGA
jgi:hypothetical protein